MLVLARSLVHESMMCNEGWDSIKAVASRMIWSSFKPIWLLPANSISGTCKDFQVIEMSMSWYLSGIDIRDTKSKKVSAHVDFLGWLETY